MPMFTCIHVATISQACENEPALWLKFTTLIPATLISGWPVKVCCLRLSVRSKQAATLVMQLKQAYTNQ